MRIPYVKEFWEDYKRDEIVGTPYVMKRSHPPELSMVYTE